MHSDDGLEVVEVPARERWEGRLAGRTVAVLDTPVRDGVVAFPHTETDPTHRGAGIADRLVSAAFAAVRERGQRARPQCSYVVRWVEEHPEQADLVA